MVFKFIENFPALCFKNFLIISDLHIGFERELSLKGINIPSQTEKMLNDILEINKKMKRKNLIILGDLKHRIPLASFQELREVPFFVKKLTGEFREVYIIKGNHDGRIEEILKGIKGVNINKEMTVDDVLMIHGNAWPSKEAIEKCKFSLMGHLHACFFYKDKLGISNYKKCWLIANIDKRRLMEEYPKKLDRVSLSKLIIFPAFNNFFTGTQERMGPIMKCIKKKEVILTNLVKVG
ncbi:MAG: metallophosphoesterase [Candidatus Parvarchaeota archaeon]|nr:metallophosphoesterase [Candidatus Jingweiarchaeum tengchongense]MCW1298358.1 metallophosphoesterase [Candidatus Jingweiarchaeum tengchongense]MCW1300340.1 metallophosphoesterase [Candidatus Jingweiarchaeum tengchongense]MCW1304863.1 metallophosphoesterase [Candidatus Jingweiarchaeum tengchongense]MCW1305836.1 metallophosphoesterase [Candidatus Jingweiarchaeum tengchongense]